MNTLEQNLRNFLIQEGLEDSPILVCVSGGVDSMVLLDIAQKISGKNVSAFHLHHGVRDSADSDEKLVISVCAEQNIPLFSEKLEKIPEKNQENFWRNERKLRAEKIAEKIGAKRILTAHHATDLVETMIFRLTKGTGIEGLSPFDTSTKPFWNIPKSDIIAYAQENNLTWNEDETNADTTYSRNNIRHQVLPALREITPNLEKVFVQESIIFQKSQEFLEQELLKNVSFREKQILLSDFLKLEDIFQMMFLRKIAVGIPSASEIGDTIRWLTSCPEGNTQKSIGGTALFLKKGVLVWE